MNVVAFDTETSLIAPACLAPKLACVTWQRPGLEAKIVHAFDAKPVVEAWLRQGDTIVGQNVAFDMAVLAEAFPELRPAIFKAYAEDRVTDTMIRQQLLDIAGGVFRGSVSAKGKRVVYEYSLDALAKRCAGMTLVKDEWRLSYGRFLDIPLDRWPDRARELQAEARQTLAELEANPLEDEKEQAKRVESLRSMVNGDASRVSTYPLDDARATLAVYLTQEKHAEYLKDQFRQARAAFALHLESAWGLRTDPEGVASLRASVESDLAEIEDDLRNAGLVREDGTRDLKAAKARMVEVCAREGIPVIRTDAHFEETKTWATRVAEGEAQNAALVAGGAKPKKIKPRCVAFDGSPLDDGDDRCVEHICLDGDACDRSGDELLLDYAERTTLGKQLSNDIPALEGGTHYPVHTRFGMAGTGRTTSSRPNIQNQSNRPGFREAFVPRPGWLFAECDYPGLELYTWAQFCKTTFGYSALADALNAGKDPHLMLASNILRISYEAAAANKKDPSVKSARDRAKPGNFGFAGGMGVPKFLTSTRKAVIKQAGRAAWDALGLDEQTGKELKDLWRATWPESGPHFARAAQACGDSFGSVVSLFTERHRGRTTYCATCNTPFQGLGADIAKEAAWRIALAQYVGIPSKHWAAAHPGERSPLFNCRAVAMVHDEFISEVPDNEHAHDAAVEQADLMLEAANDLYLPDVQIARSKMEPLLMRRWSKKAVSTFDEAGRLVPWVAPVKEAA